MKNLATSNRDEATIQRVSKECADELKLAGIKIVDMTSFHLETQKGEVPTNIIGILSSWTFARAWTYWIATGPGIPPDIAEELHKEYGRECRVGGHAGCPSPRAWFNGFGVDCYHVDTLIALQALANVIKSIDPSWDK